MSGWVLAKFEALSQSWSLPWLMTADHTTVHTQHDHVSHHLVCLTFDLKILIYFCFWKHRRGVFESTIWSRFVLHRRMIAPTHNMHDVLYCVCTGKPYKNVLWGVCSLTWTPVCRFQGKRFNPEVLTIAQTPSQHHNASLKACLDSDQPQHPYFDCVGILAAVVPSPCTGKRILGSRSPLQPAQPNTSTIAPYKALTYVWQI